MAHWVSRFIQILFCESAKLPYHALLLPYYLKTADAAELNDPNGVEGSVPVATL